MYEFRKEFPNDIHLATDQLPNEILACNATFYVHDMEIYNSIQGRFTEASNSYLVLKEALERWLPEIRYALLMMWSLCIAVFRTTTDRYGFFDPHSRQANGLPFPGGQSSQNGRAVMLTYTHLNDMINRLLKCHVDVLETPSHCEYELKPVVFVWDCAIQAHCIDRENGPGTSTAAVCQPLCWVMLLQVPQR